MLNYCTKKTLKTLFDINKLCIASVFTIILIAGLYEAAFSQNSSTRTKSAWVTNDPFSTDVFVENLGQFNKWANTEGTVKYAINSGNKIYFTQNSIIFRIDKVESMSEKEKEEFEREKGREATPEIHTYFVTMTWEGCNKNAVLEATEQSDGYFTYGDKGYEDVKAKGYKKLVYYDLYPGIDVEYYIPKKGGIKYSLILHPGADISLVKMKYSGDISTVKLNAEGDVNVTTSAGDIVDHHPESYYQSSKTEVASAFNVKNKTVSFILNGISATALSNQTIVIDPWTIVPSTLTSDNSAFDVDYDDHGNVYAGGGVVPFKVAKYNSSGTLLWTFTNPSGWAMDTYYAKFCVLPITGTVYISEGYDYGSGPAVMKINQAGGLVLTSPHFSGSNEIWMMFYNRCTGQLIGFGGGTSNQNNFHMIADTNLTSSNVVNFNGYTGGCCNDITSAEMDYNGDFYALMSSASGTPSVNNQLQKSLFSSNYLPACAFDVASGYFYEECYNYGIPGFLGSETVRSNALAVNDDYLFSWDGYTLKAWNKNTGASLGSVVPNGGYAAGENRLHEGIAVDECNHVYVGGSGTVHHYTFNGSTFTPATAISTSNEVYDLSLNKATNMLYISGYGFVAVANVIPCSTSNVLNITDTVNGCAGSACVYVNGGTPPYTYTWSNGLTTNCVTGLAPGTYVCTITDHSCILQVGTDTIVINGNVNVTVSGNTNICPGTSTTLTAAGATTYTWSPAATLSSSTGTSVTASPTANTTYTVTGNDSGCTGSASITVNISANLTPNLGHDTTLCGGLSYTLDAGYPGSTYIWTTSATTQTISVTTTNTYAVTVNSNGCSGTDAITVTFNAAPIVNLGPDTTLCGGNSLTLNAGNPGSTYIWSTGATTQSINVTSSNLYWVQASNGICTDRDSINVIFASIPIVNLGPDTNLCIGSTYTLDAGNPGSTYIWSTGALTQTLLVTTTGTYTVTVSNAYCSGSDTAHVAIQPLTVSLGNDTTLCGLTSWTLNAGNPGSTYLWSTGESTQTITIASSGNYWVSVSNPVCSGGDTINITFAFPPNVFIGNDTTICPGATLQLNAGNAGATYLWSTGATSQTITVHADGTYWVKVTANGCPGYDSIHVTVVVPLDLGRDVSLCDRDQYVLNAAVPSSSFLWSTGAITPSIVVTEAGTYWVMVNYDNCVLTDTINVTGGQTHIYVPSAFTPNGDNLNDVFMAQGEGINQYDLKIFTRWGEKIFESEVMSQGWDGKYKGAKAEMGVYVWVLDYHTICTGDRDIRLFGSVMLMK